MKNSKLLKIGLIGLSCLSLMASNINVIQHHHHYVMMVLMILLVGEQIRMDN